MAISFKSRFAVLKIEDDEDEVEEKKQCPVRVKQNSNPSVVKKKIKKKPVVEEKDDTEAELQKLAFVTVKSKKKPSASKSTSAIKKPVSKEQWEEWKKRDKNYVANSYEQDLKHAILLSKLDHEEKREVDDKQQQPAASVKSNKKVAKKKDKPPPLSLSQFNSLNPSQIANFTKDNSVEVQTPPKVLPTTNETDFWDKVVEDTENVLCQEKQANQRKSGPNLARALQYQDEIEKRDKEILTLTVELDSLKNELLTVKTRNKKLCNILGQGEMREKAEILVQVDQLTKVKDELTQEVTELHAALEQERSKVHNLQTELKKCQAGKKEFKN